jgi:predicted lipid-binding transport protein (Tim44 family)
MKRILLALSVILISLGLVFDADAARRLGGGSNLGMQRSQPMKRDAAPSQNAAKPAAPAATQPSGASRWFGPLAGLAAGIGLAALFSHLGLGEELASFAMIALIVIAVLFVLRLLLRRVQPQSQTLQYAGGPAMGPATEEMPTGGSATVARGAPIDGPAGFDPKSFIEHAKINFLRLQAANDSGNLGELREFTTPEMFVEIERQFRERGTAPQKTEVVALHAELFEVVTEFRQHIASVRFHGTIREAGGNAEPFDEIWHITMPVDESRNWAIAGIQQLS